MARYVTALEDGGSVVSTTNDRERPLVDWFGLPADVRSDFDYIRESEQDEQRFVYAYGSWFDVNDTAGLAPASLASQGWSVYLTTSHWDGYVFRHFTRDGDYLDDTVVVGHFVHESGA